MTQNVTQWLDEIKQLKQKLAEAYREREEAYASAIGWQQRYETEAHQRRIEATEAKATITALQQDIRQIQSRSIAPSSVETHLEHIQATVEQLQTEVELKSHLIQALVECDRLKQALEKEQADHAYTRKSLTTALGDAIDALAKGANPSP